MTLPVDHKIHVRYRVISGYGELRATSTVPALRAESHCAKPSKLLRTLTQLAAPHETIDVQLLDSQFTHLSQPSLRAALGYVRVPNCRFRDSTVADWLNRAHSLSIYRHTTGVYNVEELLHVLTNTNVDQVLRSSWKELSECDAVAANVSIMLSFRPKAILLDGRAPNGTLEVRIINLANRLRIPLIWDGCSRYTIEKVNCTTFASSHTKKEKTIKTKNGKKPQFLTPQRNRLTSSIGSLSTVLFRLFTIFGVIVSVEASGINIRSTTTKLIDKLSTSNGAVDIPWWRISTLLLILFGVIGISSSFKLGVSTRLVVAASRCFVQLGLLGLILVPIIKGNNALIVLGYLTLMVLVAGLEASNRPPYVYPELFGVCLTSIFCSILLIGTFVFTIVIGTKLEAQYIIPILGMLMGSSLSGISVGVSSAVKNIVDNTDTIEALLALGATKWEATQDVVKNAVILGLTSSLNQMSVTGLVSIPGMMTGQIISGTAPGLAARYQLVIMYSVTGSTCFSVMTSVLGTIWCVTDNQHRVRVERLIEREKAKKVVDVIAELLANWIRPNRSIIALPSIPTNDTTNYGAIEDGDGESINMLRAGKN